MRQGTPGQVKSGTLVIMQASSFIGDGATALNTLADDYDRRGQFARAEG